jgi:hypothetical protein
MCHGLNHNLCNNICRHILSLILPYLVVLFFLSSNNTIEIWKALGMNLKGVEFLRASEEIDNRGNEYSSFRGCK